MTFEVERDPSDQDDYSIDWTGQLILFNPVDRIIGSTWVTSTVPGNADLALDFADGAFLLPDGISRLLLPDAVSVLLLPSTAISNDGKNTTVWLSAGGKLHTKHRLVNRVNTAGGRQWDRTIEVTMRSG